MIVFTASNTAGDETDAADIRKDIDARHACLRARRGFEAPPRFSDAPSIYALPPQKVKTPDAVVNATPPFSRAPDARRRCAAG